MIKYFVFFVLLVLSSCDLLTEKKKSEKEGSNNGVKKSFSKEGKLLSEVTMKDGKRHGRARTFYKNGKVNLELNYVEDKREGKSMRYYENGILYQESEYRNDKLNGIQKRYRENGKPLSEARFEDDEPCTGLVEYRLDGSKRKDYPEIVVRPIDRLATEGRYTLELSVTEGAKNVWFYEGKLTNTGCLQYSLEALLMDPKTETGRLNVDLQPGQFLMYDFNFIAKVETMSGNIYITQKRYPLSVKN